MLIVRTSHVLSFYYPGAPDKKRTFHQKLFHDTVII